MLTKNDIQQIREVVSEEITLQVQPLNKSLRGLKMKTTHIQNTLSVAIRVFDRNHNENQKRIKKIEDHLGLATS